MNDADIFPKGYEYRFSTLRLFIYLILSGTSSTYLYLLAGSSYPGVRHSMPIFPYAASFMMLLVVVVLIFMLYRNVTSTEKIVITPSSILRIRNHRILKEIIIRDILSLKISDVQNRFFVKNHDLVIVSSKRKMIITDTMLKDKQYLDDIYIILQDLISKNPQYDS